MQSESSGPAPEARGAFPARGGRIPHLDALRCAAAVMVVAWHVVGHVAGQAAAPDGRVFWDAAARLLFMGAPVLAFLSAFLCFYNHPEGTAAPGFWKRRLVCLGVPYAVWTAVYLLLDARLFPAAAPGETLSAYGLSLLFGVRHLALISALLQFYLIFPLLRWFWNRTDHTVLVASSFLIGLAWTEGTARHMPPHLPPPVYSAQAGCVLAWLPYLALGAWASEHPELLGRLAPRPRWAFGPSAALLAAAAVAVGAVGTNPAGQPLSLGPGMLIATLLCLPFLLSWSWEARARAFGSLFREFSRYTPALFFTHLLPLSLAAMLLQGQWGPWPALLFYGLATVTGVSLIIALFSRHPLGTIAVGLGRTLLEVRPARRPPPRTARADSYRRPAAAGRRAKG